jgi:hypothetical protein
MHTCTFRRTVDWLNLWDFNEKDAVFFVFSDHGYQVGLHVYKYVFIHDMYVYTRSSCVYELSPIFPPLKFATKTHTRTQNMYTHMQVP